MRSSWQNVRLRAISTLQMRMNSSRPFVATAEQYEALIQVIAHPEIPLFVLDAALQALTSAAGAGNNGASNGQVAQAVLTALLNTSIQEPMQATLAAHLLRFSAAHNVKATVLLPAAPQLLPFLQGRLQAQAPGLADLTCLLAQVLPIVAQQVEAYEEPQPRGVQAEQAVAAYQDVASAVQQATEATVHAALQLDTGSSVHHWQQRAAGVQLPAAQRGSA